MEESSLLWVSAGLSALSSFSFGFQLGAPDAAAPSLRSCQPTSIDVGAGAPLLLPDSPSHCFPVDTGESGWGFAVGIMCLGALLGCLTFSAIADRIGRKGAILLTNLPYVLGISLSALSVNLLSFGAGRLLIGIGVGGSCVAVPLYLTEISVVRLRGVVGSLHQMAIAVGYLAVQLSALWLKKDWRLIFALNLIPCIAQLICFTIYSPESPKFVRSKQHDGPNGDKQNERCDNTASGVSIMDRPMTILQVIKSRIARRSLLTACMLHLFQQVSGINGVLYYAGELFVSLWWVPLALSLLNVAMTLLSIWLVDRAGRKSLLLLSTISCIVALLLATIGGLLDMNMLSSSGILLYAAGFALGLGPIPWLMIGEIFPAESAATAVSIAVSVNWIFAFAVTSVFPVMVTWLGSLKFIPFMVLLIPFAGFVRKAVPETKGRPAEYL